jgi:hypothetical protein
MTKPEDQSRSKSLLHLLLATARTRVLSSNNLVAARELVAGMRVEEFGASWRISTEINGKKLSIECPKNQFVFYPTKSEESYTQEPYLQNRKSANALVEALFVEAGLVESKVVKRPLNLRNFSVISGILVIQLAVLVADLVWKDVSLSYLLVTAYLVVCLTKFYAPSHLRKKVILTGLLIMFSLTLSGPSGDGYLANLGWIIFLDELASLLPRYLRPLNWVSKMLKICIFLGVLTIVFFEFSDGTSNGVKFALFSILAFRVSFLTNMPKKIKELSLGLSLIALITFLIDLVLMNSLLLFKLPVALAVSIWLGISGSRSTPLRVFSGISLLGA